MPDQQNHYRPARPEIALSWDRSRLNGVDPSGPVAFDLTDLDTDSRLLRAAMPVLDQISEQITGTGFCVLLADRECRIVASVYADENIRRSVERLGVVDGSLLAEDAAGTNAVGTPLEMGRSMIIHGDEHFLDSFKGLSCYGQPIIHPVTRRVEGILDMTGVSQRANPLFAPFLARAAADIETRLLEGSKASEQRLVEAFQRVSHRRHLAVAAIGENFLLTNHRAVDLLDSADHVTLRSLALDLDPNQSRSITVTLASGAQAHVTADRVSGAEGGALFTVQPVAASGKAAIPRSRAPESSHGERLRADLERARIRTDALWITGEPGSGRTSAAADVVQRSPARWLSATDVHVDGVDAWTRRLVDAAHHDGFVVVEHIELLPDSILSILSEIVTDRKEHLRTILTGGPISDVPPAVAAVATRCPNRLHLAPLRARRAEIPEIAKAMLRDISPATKITPSAGEALSAAPWPGNLAEMKVVLSSAARDGRRHRIDITDLPEHYRATTRSARLGGREYAEREAIIDALNMSSGNKSHASARLGISRSTLYARIRALDITT